MRIVSDFKWKQFKYDYQVSKKVLQDYEHLQGDSFDGFIKYRNRFYHLSDFLSVQDKALQQKGWHGIYNDSYFSGILIAVSDCGEMYKIATFIV